MRSEKDRMALLGGLVTTAKDRFVGHVGFNAILLYLDRDSLLEVFPEYPGTILEKFDIFIRNLFDYIKHKNLQVEFIKALLLFVLNGEQTDKHSHLLANKIYDQILFDEQLNPNTIRRPSYYITTDVDHESIGIALCISDRFWTLDW